MNERFSLKKYRRRESIGWIDMLRVIAICMVVVSHCCDNFTALYGINDDDFTLGAFVGSLVRPCVPLFAMMSGVLLLPVRQIDSLMSFYKVRIGRIIWPLVFWSLALPSANYLVYNYVWTDPVNLSLEGPYNADTLINRLYTWIFNFNYDTTPLWYVYMLFGIYLVLPIVGRWLDTASDKDIRTVLYIWMLSLIAPYIQLLAPCLGYHGNYGNMGIWGECSWNSFGSLYYVSGFIGYMILANYLARNPIRWPMMKLLSVTVPMFVIGFIITYCGYVGFMPSQNWSVILQFWSFCGINVFMMTLPIYLWVERWQIKASSVISSLAIMSFGVYLCHFSIVQWGYEIFYIDSLPAGLRLILNIVFSLSVSFSIVRLMMCSRFLRRFVI